MTIKIITVPAIKRLRVSNVGPIHTAELNFSPRVNFITGRNGTGKSTILNALASHMSDAWSSRRNNDGSIEVTLRHRTFFHGQPPSPVSFNAEIGLGAEIYRSVSSAIKAPQRNCCLLMDCDVFVMLESPRLVQIAGLFRQTRMQVIAVLPNYLLDMFKGELGKIDDPKIFLCAHNKKVRASQVTEAPHLISRPHTVQRTRRERRSL